MRGSQPQNTSRRASPCGRTRQAPGAFVAAGGHDFQSRAQTSPSPVRLRAGGDLSRLLPNSSQEGAINPLRPHDVSTRCPCKGSARPFIRLGRASLQAPKRGPVSIPVSPSLPSSHFVNSRLGLHQ